MRNVSDIGMGYNWPDVGPHKCTCTKVEKKTSKNKHTPYLEIEWVTTNGDCFTDSVFVTEKTIGRMSMIAIRVCGLDRGYQLPDSDYDAMIELEKFLCENLQGKRAVVIVEEEEYEIMPENGPDAGRLIKKKRKKVAFRGYEEIPAGSQAETKTANKADEDLPF